MNGKKPDLSDIIKVILATLIFATLTLPLLHLSGVHEILVKLSVESSKFLLGAFH